MPHQRKKLEFKNKDLWYLVGLIATDGCLSPDGRHVDITAKEYDFLDQIKKAYGFTNKIGIKRNSSGQVSHHIQISNIGFYEFLLALGLTPKKSLTLQGLDIPEECFHDFVRGVIDGDGSIRTWIHPSNGREQWSLRIYSASAAFIQWLEKVIEYRCSAAGRIHRDPRGVFVLKYGKIAAKRILQICYYDGCVSLDRKAELARLCTASRIGWNKSKTLLGSV